jgi:hypothetical protein
VSLSLSVLPPISCNLFFSVLDPRISYEGLMSDCTNNLTMEQHMERAKEQLHKLYLNNYVKVPSPPPATQPAVTENTGSPQKVNFTAWYKKHPICCEG